MLTNDSDLKRIREFAILVLDELELRLAIDVQRARMGYPRNIQLIERNILFI